MTTQPHRTQLPFQTLSLFGHPPTRPFPTYPTPHMPRFVLSAKMPAGSVQSTNTAQTMHVRSSMVGTPFMNAKEIAKGPEGAPEATTGEEGRGATCMAQVLRQTGIAGNHGPMEMIPPILSTA